MRRFYLLLAILLLTSCASVRSFDNLEYGLSIEATVSTTRAIHQCKELDSTKLRRFTQDLNTQTLILDEYEQQRPNSNLIRPMVQRIRTLVNSFVQKDSFTDQYCIHKLSNIQASSRILSRVLGETDTYNVCEGGITSRYQLFAASQKAGRITNIEYIELLDDLIQLDAIDKQSCQQVQREEMTEQIELLKAILPSVLKLLGG